MTPPPPRISGQTSVPPAVPWRMGVPQVVGTSMTQFGLPMAIAMAIQNSGIKGPLADVPIALNVGSVALSAFVSARVPPALQTLQGVTYDMGRQYGYGLPAGVGVDTVGRFLGAVGWSSAGEWLRFGQQGNSVVTWALTAGVRYTFVNHGAAWSAWLMSRAPLLGGGISAGGRGLMRVVPIVGLVILANAAVGGIDGSVRKKMGLDEDPHAIYQRQITLNQVQGHLKGYLGDYLGLLVFWMGGNILVLGVEDYRNHDLIYRLRHQNKDHSIPTTSFSADRQKTADRLHQQVKQFGYDFAYRIGQILDDLIDDQTGKISWSSFASSSRALFQGINTGLDRHPQKNKAAPLVPGEKIPQYKDLPVEYITLNYRFLRETMNAEATADLNDVKDLVLLFDADGSFNDTVDLQKERLFDAVCKILEKELIRRALDLGFLVQVDSSPTPHSNLTPAGLDPSDPNKAYAIDHKKLRDATPEAKTQVTALAQQIARLMIYRKKW